MELRHLRSIEAVADHLHFGRAATALGMTQPQVSQLVKAAERELGVALFERDTRNVRLTPPGEEFAAEARRALSIIEHASTRARAAGRGEFGTLVVGTVGSALQDPVLRLLRLFREKHSDVSVSVVELTTAEQVQALRSGSLDVGFLRPPLPDPGARELEMVTLATEPLLVVLPPGHRLAGRSAVALTALADDAMIRTPRHLGPGLHDTISTLCRAAGFEPRVAQEAVAMDTVVGLVAAGYGYAIVPASVATRTVPSISVARLSHRPPTVALALAVHRRSRSLLVERFLALARQVHGDRAHE